MGPALLTPLGPDAWSFSFIQGRTACSSISPFVSRSPSPNFIKAVAASHPQPWLGCPAKTVSLPGSGQASSFPQASPRISVSTAVSLTESWGCGRAQLPARRTRNLGAGGQGAPLGILASCPLQSPLEWVSSYRNHGSLGLLQCQALGGIRSVGEARPPTPGT